MGCRGHSRIFHWPFAQRHLACLLPLADRSDRSRRPSLLGKSTQALRRSSRQHIPAHAVAAMAGYRRILDRTSGRSLLMVRPGASSKWIFAGIAIVGVLFAGWNLALIWTHGGDAPCTLSDHEPALQGLVDRGWYVIGALGALGLGRLVSRRFGVPPFYTTTVLTMGYPPSEQEVGLFKQKERAAAWVQVLIVILLSVALFGLAYETFGVSHQNHPWPLTFLTRCLNAGSSTHVTSYSTFLVTLAVAFIIGNWFWPEPAAAGSSAAPSQSNEGGTRAG